MNEDFTKKKKELSEIAKIHGLDMIVLFGSQATGKTHPKSDIDMAVISKKSFEKSKIMDDFSKLFKREDVEVVNLSNASPTLMRAVVVDGRLLYERESGMFFQWKLYAIWVWMDTEWLRSLSRKKMIEWAKQI